MASQNFNFLAAQWEVLDKVAEAAERNVYHDPNTAISKIRTFAETIAKYITAFEQIQEVGVVNQNERLRKLKNEQIVPFEMINLFHTIRSKGNSATHNPDYGTDREATTLLQMAFRIAVWFMEVYGDYHFKAPAYIEPARDSIITEFELEQITQSYEDKLLQMERELELVRAAQVEVSSTDKDRRRRIGQRIGSNLQLTERETRVLIDEQLRDAGWEADTERLRYAHGSRPKKGENLAIAEWPLKKGNADYALFVGLKLIGLVEAKKVSKDIPSDIEQAKQYARLVVQRGDEQIMEPWGDYFVPFLFSTNGRPYLKQLKQKSGIWFLDARKSTNHPQALQGWISPDGLTQRLEQNIEQAEQALKDENFDYLRLRPYQQTAIQRVEEAIAEDQRNVLVTMATGTGKTRMAIGLIYRLIKSKRFNRILFLVDREALGEQAEAAFKDSKLESQHTFTEIYELKSLKDKKPNSETKVQIATVQGMMKRLFFGSSDGDRPTVDQYDCIIVDEAHRGYTLDKEMSDLELEIRDQNDYVSKYRQVIEYFDAVKIGLTATPALHTTEIFGRAVYTYTYTEAVIEGYLIDHEPPYQFETKLKQNGIKFEKGKEVEVYDTVSRTLSHEMMEDEVNIEVAKFNTKVVTDSFNQVVIDELVNYISPDDDGKTLIFAATDDHADKVVDMLKKKFDELYGSVEDNAIMKITGSIKDPMDAIRRFKNERLPVIAVTVDLLTTGIDVPEITNLVFLRRVKSRILFEQMLGRATRQCDRIGKDHFNIFDAVGIYEALKDYTDMKPVAANPSTTVTQLVDELERLTTDEHLNKHKEQILAKLQRKKRHFTLTREQNFEALSDGRSVKEFAEWVDSIAPQDLARELKPYASLFKYLDENKDGENKLMISHAPDEMLEVTRGYGNAEKPEDYLNGFSTFIRDNLNKIPALMLICERPSDLTREELRKLRLELDQAGYKEKSLQTAWRETKNEDIAADIIAFIRQQALGDPLVSQQERVQRAMQKVYAMKVWPPMQKKWLERIEKQLLFEPVLGPNIEQAFQYEPFTSHGGAKQLDKIFSGQLPEIVKAINKNLYSYTKKEQA
ncbi:type I restriction-modification system endonuclease [Saccharibacillus sp. JS10]|uniref:type I restriction-modification system endonuclease n=1 Tax=Saccharibacillus sp. JS10 TaxID=2950552 RepID=UPI00210BEFCF|nr:type I restriction-modification system endonuclease [Saccharibacillus sp. JS10]MCQ4085945.1 type I restriction-modification system endonuclease [Saccharibacillus sp. JS10]